MTSPYYYLDSSVLLRRLFEEKGGLSRWTKLVNPISSPLLKVECLRAIDRFRLHHRSSADYVATLYLNYHALIEGIHWIALDQPILDRASQTFPLHIRTLDALHLATALLYRETMKAEVVVATHDHRFAETAQCVGFPVIGITDL